MTTLVEQGRRVALAVRVGTHLTLAAMAWADRGLATSARGRRARTSLAADVGRHHAPDDRFPPAADAVASGFDAACWSRLAPDRPGAAMAAHFLSAVPPSLRAGLAVGRSGERRPGAATLAPGAVAAAIAFAADRRAGRRPRPHLLLPAALHLGGSIAVVTHQASLHRAARDRWMRRVAARMHRGSARGRQHHRPGLAGPQLQKVLLALGASGSNRRAGPPRSKGAHPASVVEDLEGTTLLRAALDLAIVPSDRADTFLSREQLARLAARLDQIDAEAGRSGTSWWSARSLVAVVLRYQGRSIELARPAPRVEWARQRRPHAVARARRGGVLARDHLAQPALRAPRFAIVAPASETTLLSALCGPSPPLDRPTRRRRDRARAAGGGGRRGPAALASLALAGRAPRDLATNRGLHPATHLALPAVIALALYGRRTPPPLRRTLTAILAACWALPIARDPIARPERAILGLLWLAEAHIAARGRRRWTTRVAELQARLRNEFAEQVGVARRSASDRELDRFEAQVELAERELALVAPSLDDRLVADIRTECDEVRRWLHERRARSVRVLIVEDGLCWSPDPGRASTGRWARRVSVTEAWALDHASALRSTPEAPRCGARRRHPPSERRVADPSVPLCEASGRRPPGDHRPGCRVVGYSVRGIRR
ncbi:MAG: hypothetical protein R2711_18615 [Acidimicrobiales bacterium]